MAQVISSSTCFTFSTSSELAVELITPLDDELDELPCESVAEVGWTDRRFALLLVPGRDWTDETMFGKELGSFG